MKFPKQGRQNKRRKYVKIAYIKRGIYSSSKRVTVTEERGSNIGITLTLLFYKEYGKTLKHHVIRARIYGLSEN